MKTKKIIAVLTLWASLSFSAALAIGYPQYLNDNPSYPLLYAHMDYATYLDANSVVLEHQSEDIGIVWAQYEVGAGFHYDSETSNEILKSIEEPRVFWFYFPAESNSHSESLVNINGRNISLPPAIKEIAYISYDSGAHWTPFKINDVTGVNYSKYAGFWKGLEIIQNKY